MSERAPSNLQPGASATKAPHSTVLSQARQCSRGAGHGVKKTLVEFRHPAHVRVVGENHLLLQFLCDDVGREGWHAATLALRPVHVVPVAFDPDGAAVVDGQLLQVQTTVIIFDDRRNGRLDMSGGPTHRQTTRAAKPSVRHRSRLRIRQTRKKHMYVTKVSVCVKCSQLTAHASTKHHPLRSYAPPTNPRGRWGCSLGTTPKKKKVTAGWTNSFDRHQSPIRQKNHMPL